MYPSHSFVMIHHFSSNFLPAVVVVISSKSYDSSAKHSPCHCCDVMGFKMLNLVTIFAGVAAVNSQCGMVGSDPIRYFTSIY